MKLKLGIILIVSSIISFFIYQSKDIKQNEDTKEKIIMGKIVNANNSNPIEGVSVGLQGNNPSSLSNGQGEFAILAFNNQELVFRHNNYKTKVVLAKDAKVVKMEIADSTYTNKVKTDFPSADTNAQ